MRAPPSGRAAGLAVLLGLALARLASAQSVLISNAHIIDGTGRVIEQGWVLVEKGKIVAVQPGTPASAAPDVPRIDAGGMTLMAGFIDAHRHLIHGDPKLWLDTNAADDMRAFLEAGFTTVYAVGGDDPKTVIELRRRLQSGALVGPRVLAAETVRLSTPRHPRAKDSEPVDGARLELWKQNGNPADRLAISDAEARAEVRAAKDMGFDGVETLLGGIHDGPDVHTLAVVADEARRLGLRTFTEVITVEDALAAVAAKTDALGHVPRVGELEADGAATMTIARSGIPLISTLGLFIPHFEKGSDVPLFRDGKSFPWNTLESGGQGPVNARLLWQAGATMGYGSDTTWLPQQSLMQELRALALVFSAAEILKILGPDSAAAIGRAAELGTIEPGKTADLVLLRADPLSRLGAVLLVGMVIEDGKVVLDQRSSTRQP